MKNKIICLSLLIFFGLMINSDRLLSNSPPAEKTHLVSYASQGGTQGYVPPCESFPNNSTVDILEGAQPPLITAGFNGSPLSPTGEPVEHNQ